MPTSSGGMRALQMVDGLGIHTVRLFINSASPWGRVAVAEVELGGAARGPLPYVLDMPNIMICVFLLIMGIDTAKHL